MPFRMLPWAASAFLKQKHQGKKGRSHARSLPGEVHGWVFFLLFSGRSRMSMLSSSSAFGLFGFVSVLSLSTAHTTDGTARPQLTPGKPESLTPSSWGGQCHPDRDRDQAQAQALVPQAPGTTGLLPTTPKSYLQAMHADPTLPFCSWRKLQPQSQSQWCLNLTRALLSATVSSYHSCMRASYTVSCFSLLLPVILTG